jgi:hypothetical protein
MDRLTPSNMTLRNAAAYVAGILLLFSCRSTPREEAWPPPYLKVFSLAQGREELLLDMTPIVAVGDTILVEVTRRHCDGDFCSQSLGRESWSSSATWSVDRPDIATLVDGRLVSQRPGTVRVSTSSGDTVLRRDIEVIRAVARFSWEPSLTRAHVGDTIRIKAIARDSVGRAIRVIPASRIDGGEASAPVPSVSWGGPNGTVLVASGPGQLVVTAMLGRRSAVLKMIIE